MDSRSRFLFARPSFLEGAARLVDFGNVLNTYNAMPTPAEADGAALAFDFAVVRDELKRALEKLTATV